MTDYISREGIMKEFADFVRASNNSDFEPTPNWNDAVSLVGSYPAADVVEVVRCRDCRYFAMDIMNTSIGVCCHDEWVDRQYSIGFAVKAGGFCYRGERREDE